VLSDNYENDMVYKIMSNISGNTDGSLERRNMLFSYLAPILLSSARVPFDKILMTNNITIKGKNMLVKLLREEYFKDVIDNIDVNNFYSCLMNLYKNFHLQGPTMKMIPIDAGYHGYKTAIPFLDTNIISFLEKMPPSWGRGLELDKNTKYPLKVAARKNKMFPVDIVESGIHSYPSEVDPTLRDETYNFYFNSSATDYFKSILRAKSYKEILDAKFINIEFLDKQVDHFINNEMSKVPDYYSLVRLINFVSVGWF